MQARYFFMQLLFNLNCTLLAHYFVSSNDLQLTKYTVGKKMSWQIVKWKLAVLGIIKDSPERK